ncbi:MAG: hypothetical protein ABH834_07225 [Candidatus Altiarchaeota archaeon]
MKRSHALIICLIIFAGCIDSGEEIKEKFRCADGRMVDEPIQCINELTTTREAAGIEVSSSSTTMPHSFPTTSTTSTVNPVVFWKRSTTSLSKPCTNGVLDEGEDLVDCGNDCFCQVLVLPEKGDRKLHYPSAYYFAFNGSVIVKEGECGLGSWPNTASYFHRECRNKKYVVNITLPGGIVDVRSITYGNSYYLDHLEFGILVEDEYNFTIAVRRDPETLNISEKYNILSVGGSGCAFSTKGVCQREYEGYKFRVIERRKDEVKLEITTPSASVLPTTWIGSKPVKIKDIEVGVLRPTALGGYATIFVKSL